MYVSYRFPGNFLMPVPFSIGIHEMPMASPVALSVSYLLLSH